MVSAAMLPSPRYYHAAYAVFFSLMPALVCKSHWAATGYAGFQRDRRKLHLFN